MDTAMPLPKYHQIYLVLREQLQEGRYDVDGVPASMRWPRSSRWLASPSARRWRCWWPTAGVAPAWPGHLARSAPAASATAPRPRAAQKAQLTGLMENIVNMGLRTAVRVLDCVRSARRRRWPRRWRSRRASR